MKKLFLALAAAGFLLAQTGSVAPTSPVTITGDGTVHQLAVSGSAKWVVFVAEAGNIGVARVGDSTINATKGIPLAATAGYMYPPLSPNQFEQASNRLYDLRAIYYYASSGDKVTVQWAN